MAKASELRDQSVGELEAAYLDSCAELFELRNKRIQEKKMERPHLLRQVKKRIKQILTILREKELAQEGGN